MPSLRTWVVWSVVAAVLLVSPVLAFLMIIAAEVLIDLLMEAGTTPVCAIAIAGVGWALFRRVGSLPVRNLSRGPGRYPTKGLLPSRRTREVSAPSRARGGGFWRADRTAAGWYLFQPSHPSRFARR